MLGIPLVPVHEFQYDSSGLFVPINGWSDPEIFPRLNEFVATGRPVLLSDGLVRRLSGKLQLAGGNVDVLKVSGNPQSLLQMPRRQLDELRARLLKPIDAKLRAPANVAFYPFSDGSWVLANFSDREVTVELDGQATILGARAWVYDWK
jgi:hypothetical protein